MADQRPLIYQQWSRGRITDSVSVYDNPGCSRQFMLIHCLCAAPHGGGRINSNDWMARQYSRWPDPWFPIHYHNSFHTTRFYCFTKCVDTAKSVSLIFLTALQKNSSMLLCSHSHGLIQEICLVLIISGGMVTGLNEISLKIDANNSVMFVFHKLKR